MLLPVIPGGEVSAIKIRDLRTIPVEVPGPSGVIKDGTSSIGSLCVFIDTDEGITGESLLFAFDVRQLDVFDAALRSLRDHVIGEDPRYVERVWQLLWQRTAFFGRQGVSVFAISAIDRACWDIVGKAAGQPLRLLWGARRDEVPAYASGLWLSLDIDGLLREADGYLRQGFRAIKMRIGKPRISEDLERVRAVRDAIGPDVELMVDANKRFTPAHAIRLGRRMEEFDLSWFEEPLPAHDLAGYARIAGSLDVPLAAGESVFTRYGFKEMIELRAADVLMPDLGRVGGASELLRVAAMAATFDLPVTPHNYPHESLQLLGTIATGSFVECLPWFYPLYQEQIDITDGHARIFDGPGSGCSFNPEAIERYRLRR